MTRRIGIGDLGPGAVTQARAAIGGATDWRTLADQHRPSGADEIGAEIRRLRSTGLTARDISVLLRIALPAVLEALTASPATDVMPAKEDRRGR
jgi:hypothetical protein